MKEIDFKKKLTKEQYQVLREKSTERPFTGKYYNNKEKGMYECAACGNKLFKSEVKFDSGTGWPSFYDSIPGSVKFIEDNSLGMKRTEVVCTKCGSHLGHVFDDGPVDKTGKRFCINSCSLNFKSMKKKAEE
ncbi:peptide-methionine (R)-S-oxide reductase MsrB [Candidatus Pacearchaeota archaeon]|nr:peptide-methionine (R)-S-oxide reductase MsrB [Candidatus Pacearchaeota archaeon]